MDSRQVAPYLSQLSRVLFFLSEPAVLLVSANQKIEPAFQKQHLPCLHRSVTVPSVDLGLLWRATTTGIHQSCSSLLSKIGHGMTGELVLNVPPNGFSYWPHRDQN